MPPSKIRYRIDRSRISKAKPHLSRSSSRLRRDDGEPKPATGLPPNLPNTILGKAANNGTAGEESESEYDDDSSSSDDDSSSEDDGANSSSDDEDKPIGASLSPGDYTNDSSSTKTADNPFLPKSTTASGIPATTTTAGSVAGGSTNPVTAPGESATSIPNIAAATHTSAASTSNSQPTVNTSAHHPANHTAVIAVASIIGVVAVATAVYLLCRYCKPVRDKVAALRARRSQRLGDNESPPSPDMSQVSTDVIGRPRLQALASTPNLFSGGKLKNPFSDQVPLADSEVSSNGPTLRQVSVPNNQRPPTWASSDSDTTYPADTILNEYGPAASSPLTPLPAVPALHPTGLANNPPTPVAGRRAAPPRPPFPRQRAAIQPLVPDPVGGLNIRESVSSPTPTDFPVPGPADSVVSLARPYSQYQPRIRKSITPSESASNGPFSPLPLPALPAAFNSRWSRNSSSVNNGRSTQLSKGTAIRRASDGDPVATPRPPPLPLAVKRSSAGSVASSVRSSGSGASVKDMTR
ncbi:hypothetical protein H2204_009832 [Knufia peltigerae]|uniref:Uncharacterized protein n=1 Tax=Knufia peltigerae TaxID=1002370 RepID=A0AA39CVH4_9EURO|nr:hypothetical protein H2204_009832 [Knufia peltigerae]